MIWCHRKIYEIRRSEVGLGGDLGLSLNFLMRFGTSCRVLFHSDGLGEIARLVDVGADDDGHVIGDELHRQRIDEGRDRGRHFRDRQREEGIDGGLARAALIGDQDDAAAASGTSCMLDTVFSNTRS